MSNFYNYNKQLPIPPYSNPNLLINGDFQVWQRGSMINFINRNPSGQYTADRWRVFQEGYDLTKEFSFTKVDNGLLFKGTKNNGYCILMQPLEPDLFNKLKNKKVIISYSINDIIYTKEPKYSSTYIADYVNVYVQPGDILNWVKLEIGEINTPFCARSYIEEFALCQRYYEDNDFTISYYSGTYFLQGFTYQQPKSKSPTILIKSVSNANDVISGTFNATSVSKSRCGYIRYNNGSAAGKLNSDPYVVKAIIDAEIY